MFNFTKKLAIVTSLVTIYSGQFVAFGSSVNNDEVDMRARQVAVADDVTRDVPALPRDVIKLILEEASKITNPHPFPLVNRGFNAIMIEKDRKEVSFMKKCVGTYHLFRGELDYTDPMTPGGITKFPLSDLANPSKGKMDIDYYGMIRRVGFTTDVKTFFAIDKPKDSRVMVLICSYQLAEKAAASPEHPLASVMKDWNITVAPVGVFFRLSSVTDLSIFDSMIKNGLDTLCSYNLQNLWSLSLLKNTISDTMALSDRMSFFQLRFNLPKQRV
ncbi:MAG: hypothetical protein KBB83_04830 [Alphaproteobacteria bacterium]|nr:hypothetical protein [Alphaproteobacteria bacterium]